MAKADATVEELVSQIEREIDHVVYGLYGLTEEEIKIVEGSVKRKKGLDDQTISGSEDGEVTEKKKRGRPRKA
jgi:hypothetical protein